MWHLLKIGFLGILLLVTSVACGERSSGDERSGGHVVVGQASAPFPYETLEDWKSYADHVAVFTVMDEEEVPFKPADDASKTEGSIQRKLTLRIDETVWSAADAPALPAQIKMNAPGWVLHDGKRSVLRISGVPRVRPGERYLAPLVRVETITPPRWWPLYAGAQLLVEHGRIAPNAQADPSLRTELAGQTVEQVAAAVERQAPDPVAFEHRAKRPYDRFQTVKRQKGRGVPAEGERP